MNQQLFLALGLSLVIAGCGEPEKDKTPVEPGVFTQNLDETIRPANPITKPAWIVWQTADAQNLALIPSDAAIFSTVFEQTTPTQISPEQARKANAKLSAEGKNVLSYALRRCRLRSPSVISAGDSNGSTLLEGTMSVDGDYCKFALNESHKTTRKVTAVNSESETFTIATQSITSSVVKDTDLKSKAGIVEVSKTLNISGSFIRYFKSSFAYSSGKVIVQGTFTAKLADGTTMSGTIAGEANLGSNYSSQYLVEATTPQGDVRYVVKRNGSNILQFVNGTAATGVPDFLNLVSDY